MGCEHSFDWKGFQFVAKSLITLLVVSTAGYFSFLCVTALYATPTHSPSLAAVQVVPNTSTTTPVIQPFSTTTPERTISMLTADDVIPQTGKFIVADLEKMKLTLYRDGSSVAGYTILTKGKPSSPYETPSGFYNILLKEADHFNKREQVHMPYSMQFYGNYFIHGWPYYPDSTPVASTYSGGCIRLSTSDAEEVYAFAEKGTGVFVYDPVHATLASFLVLDSVPAPPVSAVSYLVADIDTGDVYAEQNAENVRPIASLTKLMTALVANETIMFNDTVTVTRNELLHADQDVSGSKKEKFLVGDLLYPLLMESNNAVADRLAQRYGTTKFVDWMNTAATALGMQSTHFTDASGVSSGNVSTTDDLFRLARYLTDKKSFIWNITRIPTKEIVAASGNMYYFNNFNIFSNLSNFIGGKVGQTVAAQDTMVSVFAVPVNGAARRVAIIVLKSNDYAIDTKKLADWFTQAAQNGTVLFGAACVSCSVPHYREIQ